MTFSTVTGGNGELPEPDWASLFSDDLDLRLAREQWGIITRELRDTEKLATANAHQIKRLVISYVLFEVAARRVSEQGAVMKAKRSKAPQYNPWFTVMKDANAMAAAAEAELTVTPRRRNNGGKVQRKEKKVSPSDKYLRPVTR